MFNPARINIGYCLVFLFIQFSFGLDDTQAWISISIEKKLPNSLSIEFEQELRLKNQLSTFSQTFSEVSLSYKVFDRLNISIPYRYAIFDGKTKQRFSVGVSTKYNFKPITLKYRLKFQQNFENEETQERLGRNKLTLQYKLSKKIEPYISGEVFHQFNKDDNQLDEYRISFGMTLDLLRKNSIQVFYTFKREDLNKTYPDEINIFGISYRIKL